MQPVALDDPRVGRIHHYLLELASLREDHDEEKRRVAAQIAAEPFAMRSVLPDKVVEALFCVVREERRPLVLALAAEDSARIVLRLENVDAPDRDEEQADFCRLSVVFR